MTTEDPTLAICSKCNSVVSTMLEYRNMPTSDRVVTVLNVLVIVCKVCDTVCGIPAKSVPHIQEVIKSTHES